MNPGFHASGPRRDHGRCRGSARSGAPEMSVARTRVRICAVPKSLPPYVSVLSSYAARASPAVRSRRSWARSATARSTTLSGASRRPSGPVGPTPRTTCASKARDLRLQGLDYEEIAGALGVAKSSVSLWVRDLPRPARLSSDECARRTSEGTRRYWTAERPVRAAGAPPSRAAAAAEIGDADRPRAPHRRRHRLLVRRGEEQAAPAQRPSQRSRTAIQNSFASSCSSSTSPTSRARICPSHVQIHESADVASAERFWLALTGARPEQFRKTSLKRHNPETTRKNTGRRLLRMPAGRRKAKLRALQKDRGMGLRSDESRGGAGLARSLRTAPGEGFEPPSNGTKTRCLAWLDHPG